MRGIATEIREKKVTQDAARNDKHDRRGRRNEVLCAKSFVYERAEQGKRGGTGSRAGAR